MAIDVDSQVNVGIRDEIYFVGIDGGASHSRAKIFDRNQKLLGYGKSGPANPVNGLQQTQQSITQVVELALVDAGLSHISLSQLVVGAGLAGLHLPSMQQAMSEWTHPFQALYLTSDLHAAILGAHHSNNGAVIILGTGFSALGLVEDKPCTIGGYGFPINATCSGAWLGLELVKAVLLDADEVGEPTSLTSAVLQDTAVLDLAEKMNNAPANEFARFAPLVFEHAKQGDSLSIALLQQGAAFINRVMQKLVANGVNNIAFIGGVAPHIFPWLDSQYLPFIVEVKSSPEWGAMYFAKQKSTLGLFDH